MRIDRFLSNMGYGTRTEIKIAMLRCQVKVNGKIVKKTDTQIDNISDVITYDEHVVAYQPFVYIMLNKPQGFISATQDAKEKTVMDLLEDRLKNRAVFPVGRLDKDTEGLLLLTDDGKLAHDLLSPKKHVAKTYLVHCIGPITDVQKDQLEAGVMIDEGYTTKEAQVKILKQGLDSELLLTIYEGKFHQVKRMLQKVGSEVTFLKRLSMGGLRLDESLPLGGYRPLTEEELHSLMAKKQIEKE